MAKADLHHTYRSHAAQMDWPYGILIDSMHFISKSVKHSRRNANPKVLLYNIYWRFFFFQNVPEHVQHISNISAQFLFVVCNKHLCSHSDTYTHFRTNCRLPVMEDKLNITHMPRRAIGLDYKITRNVCVDTRAWNINRSAPIADYHKFANSTHGVSANAFICPISSVWYKTEVRYGISQNRDRTPHFIQRLLNDFSNDLCVQPVQYRVVVNNVIYCTIPFIWIRSSIRIFFIYDCMSLKNLLFWIFFCGPYSNKRRSLYFYSYGKKLIRQRTRMGANACIRPFTNRANSENHYKKGIAERKIWSLHKYCSLQYFSIKFSMFFCASYVSCSMETFRKLV